jgi:hypothetical protein
MYIPELRPTVEKNDLSKTELQKINTVTSDASLKRNLCVLNADTQYDVKIEMSLEVTLSEITREPINCNVCVKPTLWKVSCKERILILVSNE